MGINEIIKKLSEISTPIVYDAIEKFEVQDATDFYTDDSINSIFPEKGSICGFACTAKITAVLPKADNEYSVSSKEVWKYVYDSKRPSVMVVEDIDTEPKRACAWGDFSASIYSALGCKGCITNGFVRDIDVVKDMDFKFFARSVIAGHGHIRTREIDTPVCIGGMTISAGDLVHADVHGAIIIPKSIDLEKLLEYIDLCLYSEGEVIKYCQKTDFTLEGLYKEVDEHDKRSGSHFK